MQDPKKQKANNSSQEELQAILDAVMFKDVEGGAPSPYKSKGELLKALGQAMDDAESTRINSSSKAMQQSFDKSMEEAAGKGKAYVLTEKSALKQFFDELTDPRTIDEKDNPELMQGTYRNSGKQAAQSAKPRPSIMEEFANPRVYEPERAPVNESKIFNDALTQALDIARGEEENKRKQQTHEVTLAEKNQRMEIEAAKAQNDGIITMADANIATTPPPTKTSPIMGEINQRAAVVSSLLNQPQEETTQDPLVDFLRTEMLTKLQSGMNEKNLAFSPIGGLGKLLALPFDLAGLPFGQKFGTQMFGGKMPDTAQAVMYAKLLYQTSPLVRSEMSDRLGRDKMEQTAYDRLRRANLPVSLASFSRGTSADSVDDVIATAIDMRRTLANSLETQNAFGTDAPTSFTEMFDQFDTIDMARNSFGTATTPQEIEELKIGASVAAEGLQTSLQQYMMDGGTPATFLDEIRRAIETIDAKYQQDLVYNPGESKEAFQFRAMQKATANEYASKLQRFADNAVAIMKELEKEIKPAIEQKAKEKRAKSGERFRSFGVYG
jgi:hypothetical protein